MKRAYEVAGRSDKRAIAEFMKREGQFLLPMVELVERPPIGISLGTESGMTCMLSVGFFQRMARQRVCPR
jgi:hypothetical protein